MRVFTAGLSWLVRSGLGLVVNGAFSGLGLRNVGAAELLSERPVKRMANDLLIASIKVRLLWLVAFARRAVIRHRGGANCAVRGFTMGNGWLVKSGHSLLINSAFSGRFLRDCDATELLSEHLVKRTANGLPNMIVELRLLWLVALAGRVVVSHHGGANCGGECLVLEGRGAWQDW